MGTWGKGALENDDALDFLGGLFANTAQAQSLLLEMHRGRRPSGLSDTEMLALCELAAQLRGSWGDDVIDRIEVFGRSLDCPSDLAAGTAIAICEEMKARGELRELWDDAGKLEPWCEEVDHLISRLKASAEANAEFWRREFRSVEEQESRQEPVGGPKPVLSEGLLFGVPVPGGRECLAQIHRMARGDTGFGVSVGTVAVFPVSPLPERLRNEALGAQWGAHAYMAVGLEPLDQSEWTTYGVSTVLTGSRHAESQAIAYSQPFAELGGNVAGEGLLMEVAEFLLTDETARARRDWSIEIQDFLLPTQG